MPYASVFPVSQIFSSPLAVDIIHSGVTYKCIFRKTDISQELSAENFEITAEVKAATGAVISDRDAVIIAGVTYYVSYSIVTLIGTIVFYLSKADSEPDGVIT
jgi:hypothetical protein